jgi:hypothetical protein
MRGPTEWVLELALRADASKEERPETADTIARAQQASTGYRERQQIAKDKDRER